MPDRPWRDDEEDWSETGGDDNDFDEDETDAPDSIPCPECGTAIYADLNHCPRCGHWLTDADHRDSGGPGLFSSRRVRIVATAMLAIFVLGLILSIVAM